MHEGNDGKSRDRGGITLSPPLKYKAAMERAVVEAYFYMQDRVYKVQSKDLFYPDPALVVLFIPDAEAAQGTLSHCWNEHSALRSA